MKLVNADKVIRDIEERYDIPNMAEEYAFNKGISEMKNCALEVLNNAQPVNAIPIPKGASNGDIIKAMFPNIETTYKNMWIGGFEVIRVHNLDGVTEFTKDWWNAPYKGK